MRIALVSPYDYGVPGGVNKHIGCIANVFTDMGHTAHIIAPCSDKDYSGNNHLISASSSIIRVPFAGSVARISLSPRSYRRVKGILQDGHYDVLHLHEPLMPTLPLAVLRHRDLVPQAICVGTFHAYREVSRAYYYGRSIFMRFFKKMDSMIVVSEAARQYHMRYFQANYASIPNGVDLAHFANPRLEPIARFADGRPNILFVGRLEKRKGLPYLIEAFALVRQAIPQARLLVVGAYDRLDKLPYMLQARQLKLSGIHFIGRVDDADLARYYRTATLFCAPSTGMESFGMILLEAMAAGTPIVASNIDGYREVVTDGAEGLLAPPEDPSALAQTLIALLNDPDRRQAMSAAGSRKAAGYDWSVIAQRVLDHYAGLLERHRHRLKRYQPVQQQPADV